MKKYDVFISSKSEDYSLAEKICDFLTSNGLSVFIASRELQRIGIAQYAKAIDEILDNSVHMIVVASSLKNIQSKWVEYEWSLFSNDLKSGYRNGNLMTVLSDDVELKSLPGSLRHQQSFNINSYQNDILGYLKIDKAETTDLDDINPGQETICLPNGDKYIGQVMDGNPDGRGTLYYADGGRYEGELEYGLSIGQRTPKIKFKKKTENSPSRNIFAREWAELKSAMALKYWIVNSVHMLAGLFHIIALLSCFLVLATFSHRSILVIPVFLANIAMVLSIYRVMKNQISGFLWLYSSIICVSLSTTSVMSVMDLYNSMYLVEVTTYCVLFATCIFTLPLFVQKNGRPAWSLLRKRTISLKYDTLYWVFICANVLSLLFLVISEQYNR